MLSNETIATSHDITISLLAVTLPDGTPLDEAGYSVAFDSGLSWGTSVPEPGSVAIWTVVVAGLGIAARKGSRLRSNRVG
jgi:hypothetical protein